MSNIALPVEAVSIGDFHVPTSEPTIILRDFTPGFRSYLNYPSEDAEVIRVREETKGLINQWIHEIRFLSSPSQMYANESYQTIIEIGPPAIPLLLDELRHRPRFWFHALRTILKNEGQDINPVNQEDRGDLEKMAAAWLQWGEENGYI